MGSRDRSVSIWLTSMNRPLVVVYNLFEDSILDLSWSHDKHVLLACSTDGTVAGLLFTDDELGTTLSQEEKVSHLIECSFIPDLTFLNSLDFSHRYIKKCTENRRTWIRRTSALTDR